jgi:hypothetical protein
MPDQGNRSDSPPPPTSAPPESAVIDANWDDDVAIGKLDDPDHMFDRITAVPLMPPEIYVPRMMAQADRGDKKQRSKQSADDRPSAPSPDSFSLPPIDSLNPPSVPSERPEEPPPPPEADLASSGALEPAYAEMKDRYAMGDFTGALVIAESVLEVEQSDAEALRYAESCRKVLTQMYAARLGALDRVVTVAVPADQIRWLSLDHRAGFLLSLVDGISTLEEILDISGMSRLEALRIMYALLEQRVISIEATSR